MVRFAGSYSTEPAKAVAASSRGSTDAAATVRFAGSYSMGAAVDLLCSGLMGEGETVTLLLGRMKGGDSSAMDALVPLVYQELRRMAASQLRAERSDHTLQPTALVHEAYLRLAGQNQPDYQSRAHFYAVASQVMRQVLVDSARKKKAAKRGSGAAPLALDDVDAASRPLAGLDLVTAVDDALKTLEKQDEVKAKLIEMRFFGGLTAEESAEILHMPVQTVRRQLRVAQAWLQRELDRSKPVA